MEELKKGDLFKVKFCSGYKSRIDGGSNDRDIRQCRRCVGKIHYAKSVSSSPVPPYKKSLNFQDADEEGLVCFLNEKDKYIKV